MKDYSTTTFGKWILAGEHSVLRGCPALAFPLTSKALELHFTPGGSVLDVRFEGEHGAELKLLFYGVIENALNRLKIHEAPKGTFVIRSDLPVGAGLGASAALTGAVARWCGHQGWIAEAEIYEFARKLEDLFHGESSGVDLAVSLSAQGVWFQRGGERKAVEPAWWPQIYLSYCGSRGMTSDCVNKVKKLFETDHGLAASLDQQMKTAVERAALALSSRQDGAFAELKAAIHLARSCFEQWGLCGGDLGQHLRRLEQSGAVAVKPTGSGGGGYALSLWNQEPPEALRAQLIRVPEPARGLSRK